MIWMLWLLIPAALLVFVAILLVRTAAFTPRESEPATQEPVGIPAEKVVADMQALIRCKTVSNRDPSQEDPGEFQKLHALLPTLYPHVYQTCTLETAGDRGLLFRWKGKSAGDPAVFMAHYDVVPVNPEGWKKPPFDAILEDGVLWGRGTLDTKGTFCGVLEAADALIAEGFTPERDVYFSFSGNEEISGVDAPAIVELFKQRGLHPSMVLDEGGAVVTGVFPGVERPCALIGTGEKGIMDLELTTLSAGGHASSPPPHTPVGVLADACVKVENHPFPFRITAPAAGMFDTLGRYSTFVYRMIFANLWCFKPVLNALCKKKGGELNALMRTTVAFTMMQGSRGANVIPPEAHMVANLRLNGGETVENAQEYLRKIIQNDAVSFRVIYGADPSPVSRTEGEGWERVTGAIAQTWPEALISPYLMVAASDSRHFAKISENVYRFSAMALTSEERATIHGNNERVPAEKLVVAAQFFARVMKRC